MNYRLYIIVILGLISQRLNAMHSSGILDPSAPESKRTLLASAIRYYKKTMGMDHDLAGIANQQERDITSGVYTSFFNQLESNTREEKTTAQYVSRHAAVMRVAMALIDELQSFLRNYAENKTGLCDVSPARKSIQEATDLLSINRDATLPPIITIHLVSLVEKANDCVNKINEWADNHTKNSLKSSKNV